MKTLLFYIVTTLTLVFNPESSPAQKIFSIYESKEALESDARQIIGDFDAYIRTLGFTPEYVPGVIIKTEPYLIKWDNPNKSVVIPFWDELTEDQKRLFVSWRGEDAEVFFVALFNWLLIPHELGHFLTRSDYGMNRYKSEQIANEFAVAFLKSNKENNEKIEYVRKSLQEVFKLLPSIDFNNMSEEEYFNTYHSELSRNPNKYGYFQLKFILEIMDRSEDINITRYLNK